jgi:hypothetical protein
MTKKDFELIAATLKARRIDKDVPQSLVSTGMEHQWRSTCHAFAQALSDAHPRFDRARFLAACGVEG